MTSAQVAAAGRTKIFLDVTTIGIPNLNRRGRAALPSPFAKAPGRSLAGTGRRRCSRSSVRQHSRLHGAGTREAGRPQPQGASPSGIQAGSIGNFPILFPNQFLIWQLLIWLRHHQSVRHSVIYYYHFLSIVQLHFMDCIINVLTLNSCVGSGPYEALDEDMRGG